MNKSAEQHNITIHDPINALKNIDDFISTLNSLSLSQFSDQVISSCSPKKTLRQMIHCSFLIQS